MNEEVRKLLIKFEKELPKFKDGRINYRDSKEALVVNIVVKYKDKILILKRSNKVSNYRGCWGVVAGYIDENKPIFEKILEELEEELGIKKEDIENVRYGKLYKFKDKKLWIVCPVLIELKEMPNIKLNWEHLEYKWIKFEEINKFNTPPKLKEIIQLVLN